ncbi:hypothetical protein [Limnohabitans sp. MMS-10A-192]|uniref:hypothetical protein n=1 Tax=unclassified Limnohabitans TaxID=2626134 RepID=UPI003512EF44
MTVITNPYKTLYAAMALSTVINAGKPAYLKIALYRPNPVKTVTPSAKLRTDAMACAEDQGVSASNLKSNAAQTVKTHRAPSTATATIRLIGLGKETKKLATFRLNMLAASLVE